VNLYISLHRIGTLQSLRISLEVSSLSQFLAQSTNFLPQGVKIAHTGLIQLHLHLEDFGPFGKHEGGESISEEASAGVDIS
jgi:hypothetical protein